MLFYFKIYIYLNMLKKIKKINSNLFFQSNLYFKQYKQGYNKIIRYFQNFIQVCPGKIDY